MEKVAVIGDLTAKPACFDEFFERMKAHAAASRREPGCLRFDLVRPQGESHRLMLFELYTDQAALDAHGSTERIKAHRKATAALVTERTITFCDLADSGDM